MPSQVTSELLQKASRGDASALDQLLIAQLPALRAFVRLRLGPLSAHESSSDLLQSVCREVLVDLPRFQFQGEVPFKKWLYVAALNKINEKKRFWLRDKRAAAREQPLEDDAGTLQAIATMTSPSRAAIKKEEVGQLCAAFDQLPEDYREVITCARMLGMSHAEIAERMGRTEGAVRVLFSRAVARLGVLLEGGGSA